MTEIDLRLNPALDPTPFAEAYARDGVVQIPGLFEPHVAEAIALTLERDTPWDLTFWGDEGRPEALDLAAVRALGKERLGQVARGVVERSRAGFGYIYLGYSMIAAHIAGRDPGHPLHAVTEFLNSPEFMDFGRAVIGGGPLTKVEAHATCYRPGDFLNLHDDAHRDRRRAAYTLGFSKGWRPDWGGQLLFHDKDGEIERGFTPGFNLLTLFRTPRPHSVATVAPYAGRSRLSIVGWLRDDPVGG
jgi:SM-20-related protein